MECLNLQNLIFFSLLEWIVAHFRILNCAEPKSVGLELHITIVDVPELCRTKKGIDVQNERKMV
jgi:hypothetical protein